MPLRRTLRCLAALAALGLAAEPAAAWVSRTPAATDDPAGLCEAAARQAAAESGVPGDILAALTLTETGRRRDGAVRPWAWSVNAEGAGSWFPGPAPALAFAEARLAAGRQNLDIGCFQLNVRWHGRHFASLPEMFDPLANARYAARFLGQLRAETGDWRRAAGAFHSRSPAQAARYLARFDTLHAAVLAGGTAAAPETFNRFASAEPTLAAGAGPAEDAGFAGASRLVPLAGGDASAGGGAFTGAASAPEAGSDLALPGGEDGGPLSGGDLTIELVAHPDAPWQDLPPIPLDEAVMTAAADPVVGIVQTAAGSAETPRAGEAVRLPRTRPRGPPTLLLGAAPGARAAATGASLALLGPGAGGPLLGPASGRLLAAAEAPQPPVP